jgi:hypothetical protein
MNVLVNCFIWGISYFKDLPAKHLIKSSLGAHGDRVEMLLVILLLLHLALFYGLDRNLFISAAFTSEGRTATLPKVLVKHQNTDG